MKQVFKIRIGTIIFEVYPPEGLPVEIHPFIKPFQVAQDVPSNITIQLSIGIPGLPARLNQHTSARYLPQFQDDAWNQYFYTLNKTETEFIILAGKERDPDNRRMAVSDFSFRNWSVYLSEEEAAGKRINPLNFPLGPLIFYYGLSSYSGFLLHASGIDANQKGYIFSGYSGVGKTTISNLWLADGAGLINDDRLAIMRASDGFAMYNTPMAYHQGAKSCPVSSIFLLRQSPENYSQKLSKSVALARVLSMCIQHDHDKILVDNLVKSVHALVEEVSVYELGFRPDNTIVGYMKDYDL